MVHLRNTLGRFCAFLGDALTEASRRLIACPDCGRSRFYGAPCK